MLAQHFSSVWSSTPGNKNPFLISKTVISGTKTTPKLIWANKTCSSTSSIWGTWHCGVLSKGLVQVCPMAVLVATHKTLSAYICLIPTAFLGRLSMVVASLHLMVSTIVPVSFSLHVSPSQGLLTVTNPAALYLASQGFLWNLSGILRNPLTPMSCNPKETEPCGWCQVIPPSQAVSKTSGTMAVVASECLGSLAWWNKFLALRASRMHKWSLLSKNFYFYNQGEWVDVVLPIPMMPSSHLFYCLWI